MKSNSFRKRKRGSAGMMDNGIHEMANSLRKRFEELPPLSSKCCIYRVPRTLRNVNLSAYKPCLISIGPLHHGIKRLKDMQEQKLRYAHNFIRRNEERRSLKDYLKTIKKWEQEARDCYIERIHLSSDEFVEMVFVDGCFIIEYFMNWYMDTLDEDDRIFGKPSLEHVIRRDLLLIENQLPFFVLEGLYNLAFKDDSDEFLPFVNLASEVLLGERKVPKKFKGREFLHFVDFLRTYFLPSRLRDLREVPRHDVEWDFPSGVGDLHDAGVQFKVRKNNNASLLDIEFNNGVLYIPKLDVEDHTEALLLNLSAFEQCHYHSDSYIVDYILLMDVLITTLKDVDILISNGIVTNSLGNNDDVARLFNTICREAAYKADKFYYSDLCRRLVTHSKAPWNRWKATLRHDYFNNPWTIISVVAAVVLLILTVIQTACCILSLKR